MCATSSYQGHMSSISAEVDFLNRFGVEKTERNDQGLPVWIENRIKEAGYDLEEDDEDDSHMPVRSTDMMFCDEEVARYILSGDFNRILGALSRLKKATPSHATRIAELGGGVGLLSFWLAKSMPNCQFTVVDKSANSLAMGEKWAKKAHLTNVSFLQASYEDIGANEWNANKFDFVFAEAAIGISLRFSRPTLEFPISTEMLETHSGDAGSSAMPLLRAAEAILSPDGTLFVSAYGLSMEAMYSFFKTTRLGRLRVDWKKSSSRGNVRLFLSPRAPEIFADAEAEAFAICTSTFKTKFLSAYEADAVKAFFDGGRQILHCTYSTEEGEGMLTIKEGNGLAYLFQGLTSGDSQGCLTSASRIPSLIKLALRHLRKTSSTTIFDDTVAYHPSLAMYFPEIVDFTSS